jgi:hypothetical protein
MADISTAGGILSAETIQALVVEPLMRESVGTQVSTVVSASSHSTRFPIVQQDPADGPRKAPRSTYRIPRSTN